MLFRREWNGVCSRQMVPEALIFCAVSQRWPARGYGRASLSPDVLTAKGSGSPGALPCPPPTALCASGFTGPLMSDVTLNFSLREPPEGRAWLLLRLPFAVISEWI